MLPGQFQARSGAWWGMQARGEELVDGGGGVRGVPTGVRASGDMVGSRWRVSKWELNPVSKWELYRPDLTIQCATGTL